MKSLPPSTADRAPYGLVLLILVQILCAVFFLADIIDDYRETGWASDRFHMGLETVATLTLVAAIVFEIRFILTLLRRKAHLERSVSIATSAMHDVIDAHFRAWDLTPAETDVATFLVKGFGIHDIARLRGSAEGTVKSQLNAIYRKSGTHNRGEVLALIIDSLMDGPSATLPPPAQNAAG